MALKKDDFLADLHAPKLRSFTYQDGFRFGLGLAVANLMVTVVVGAIAWGLIVAFNIH